MSWSWPPKARHFSLPLAIGLLFALVPATVVAQVSPQKPLEADTDLICHTSDPKDCYPRIFVPTDEFQAVHDDQELPKGLHVRLDIWTGKKEAKIDVPEEKDPSIERLAGDKAVLVVQPDEQVDQGPRLPKDAPKYEPVGKIKKPEQDAELFATAMNVLKQGATASNGAFDSALETLQELSHDIYYGYAIMADSAIAKKLFCLMAGQDARQTEGQEEISVTRDRQAASVLAGALRNNPSALREVMKIWPELKQHACPLTATANLRDTLFWNLVPSSHGDAERSTAARLLAKAKMSVVDGLLKDDSIRRHFLDSGGMGGLVEVLVPQGHEWNDVQRKAGQLALEHFLDADMGAELGQWPRVAKVGREKCQLAESAREEGCWDYHVERIQEAHKDDEHHWSRHVKDRLVAARKKTDTGAGEHEEL
ncbi:hypothetical protein CDD82_887 [Ophiocordyceps australis]|uniref:Nucleotide exchange factor SIL1 n=1 Tax=Ophiocordyceps australis TaxID=1399860 RepID=A0A2C5YKM2_9HYPO|nr:hypothetical protein CDD82_887 [Ophiocordyceps australis]